MFFNTHEQERSGARQFLEAMQKIPAAREALAQLDQGLSIIAVGTEFERVSVIALREEFQRNEILRGRLQDQENKVAELSEFIQNFNIGPRKAAEQARAAAEEQLLEAQHDLAALKQQRERELAANAREIQELRQQNAELNRLVIKQREGMSDLNKSDHLNNSPIN